MFNHQAIEMLRDIRVELLRYWQQEKQRERRDLLSDKLNKLDDYIISLEKRPTNLEVLK